MFEFFERYIIINLNNKYNIFIICLIYIENDMWLLKGSR